MNNHNKTIEILIKSINFIQIILVLPLFFICGWFGGLYVFAFLFVFGFMGLKLFIFTNLEKCERLTSESMEEFMLFGFILSKPVSINNNQLKSFFLYIIYIIPSSYLVLTALIVSGLALRRDFNLSNFEGIERILNPLNLQWDGFLWIVLYLFLLSTLHSIITALFLVFNHNDNFINLEKK